MWLVNIIILISHRQQFEAVKVAEARWSQIVEVMSKSVGWADDPIDSRLLWSLG